MIIILKLRFLYALDLGYLPVLVKGQTGAWGTFKPVSVTIFFTLG